MTKNIFENNLAAPFALSDGTRPRQLNYFYEGGAIRYYCMKAETDCDLQISKDNTFQNNTAFTQGGAVQQKSAYANFEGTVREFGKENPDNKAYEYGPIVGLFPYSIKVFVNNAS